MTKEELFKLIDAGFTREEILKIEEPAAPAAAAPDPAPAPAAAAPDPAPAPAAAAPDPAPAPAAAAPDPMAKLNTAIDNFITRLQAVNIGNSQQPPTPEETPEDILTKLLMPSYNKKEG